MGWLVLFQGPALAVSGLFWSPDCRNSSNISDGRSIGGQAEKGQILLRLGLRTGTFISATSNLLKQIILLSPKSREQETHPTNCFILRQYNVYKCERSVANSSIYHSLSSWLQLFITISHAKCNHPCFRAL